MMSTEILLCLVTVILKLQKRSVSGILLAKGSNHGDEVQEKEGRITTGV